MNVGRALTTVFVLALTLSALSGLLNPAAAQGAGADTPSGYALSPVVDDPETQTLAWFTRGLRFLPAGHSPLFPGFLAWAPAKRASVASNRIAVVPSARRTAVGPPSRQRALPGGR